MSFGKFLAFVPIVGVSINLLGGIAIAQPSPSDYFPLEVGNHWKLSTQPQLGDPTERWTFIDMVDDTVFGTPGEVRSYQTEYSENIVGNPDTATYRTVWYTFNGNGDLCWSAYQIDTLVVLDPLLVYLRNPISVGDSTQYVSEWGSVTWTVLSVSDTLDLPLGHFDNCLLIRQYLVREGQPLEESFEHYIPCAQPPMSCCGLGRTRGTHWEPPDSGSQFCSYLVDCNFGNEADPTISIRPNSFSLRQNYPNPFNPSTRIAYELPKAGHVSLKVFDLLGREIATLVNEIQPVGSHSVTFNGSALASGIYFYRLQAGDFATTKKMVLLK